MTGVLTGREDRQRYQKRRPYEDGGTAESDAVTSHGMPRIAGNHQKLGGGKTEFFPRIFRAWPFQHTDLRLVACRPMRERIRSLLNHRLSGNFL